MDGSALNEFRAEKKPVENRLVRMSEVEPQEPKFLWWPYIRRNLNNNRGDGGTGKSSFTFALTAAITTGKQPEGMPGRLNIDRPRTVIYLGTEDDPSQYRLMLDRQGANVDNVLMPSGRVPTMAEFNTYEDMIRQYEAALLVIDPIQALLPGEVDMNRANEIRPILDGLREVSRQTDCAILMIEHLNKATKAANTYRGSGSMDFYNAARSVLMTGWTPDGRRACGHLKSNGAAYGPAIIFDIGPGGRLEWRGGDPSISGEDILPTRPRAAANLAPNPYGLLIAALPRAEGVWEGTPAQAIAMAPALGISMATSPEAFGKAVRALNVDGVTCTSKRTNHGTVYHLEVAHDDG